MSKAMVVIGANFGDEGKGVMTDYLASMAPEKSLIVRFNGGAQAGHTVCNPDGRRHVFSHFGSGTFLDCPSYLSRFFIVNPMLFCKELAELKSKNLRPQLYIDPAAILSTPIDIFLNQLLESSRGGKRHGSCGVGINETVTRCLHDQSFKTTVADLYNPEMFKDRLFYLCENWLPRRLHEHKLEAEQEAVKAFESSFECIVDRFLQDVDILLANSTLTSKIKSERVIFEGAQGLMLDEFRLDQFPHLTRSRTGLSNVLEMLDQFEVDELDVTYMSRTYLTRHGAGPLKGESDFSFPDSTNIANQFQGKLRFAPLDLEDLSYSINLDLLQARTKFDKIKASIAFTCADQLKAPSQSSLPLPLRLLFFGPSREDAKVLASVY